MNYDTLQITYDIYSGAMSMSDEWRKTLSFKEYVKKVHREIEDAIEEEDENYE